MERLQSHARQTLSVVIPVWNEAHNIAPMHTALASVRREVPSYDFEVVFVDDGSRDGTWEHIALLAGKDASVQGIRFARNFGKEAAIEAGLARATGDAVIIMDGDLQHPPELIPRIVAAWEAGNDIVRAAHPVAPHNGLIKRATSSFFYFLFNAVSDTAINPGASDFCLLSRPVVDALKTLPEKQRFHRMLSEWVGFSSTSIRYEAKHRMEGKSAYTLRKLLSLAKNALISSSTLPMTLIFVAGCFLALLGAVLTVGLLAYKYFVDFEYVGGAVVLAAFVIFNNGLLLVAFGVMSLYQVATYREVQNRPSFIVRETT